MSGINLINRYFETPSDQGIGAACNASKSVLLIVLNLCWRSDTSRFIFKFLILIFVVKKMPQTRIQSEFPVTELVRFFF